MKYKMLCCLATASMAVLGSSTAGAQAGYPDHSIRVLVGQSPGSATDTVARLITDKMSEELKQSMVVENRPGAGGIVAAQSVAREKPDGYVIMMATASQTSLSLHLLEHPPYDPFKDFTYIAPATDVAMILLASPGSGIKDFASLLEMAKRNPGKITFGSSGVGSASQLSLEMVSELTGIKLLHVPYKGTNPAVTALMANETDLHVNALGVALPLIKAGKVVPIALLIDKRSALLPDVPALSDLGLTMPRVPAWIGLIGPAGMPKDVVDRLADALHNAQKSPEVQQRFTSLGYIPFEGDGAYFLDRSKNDSEVWGKLIKDRGIRP